MLTPSDLAVPHPYAERRLTADLQPPQTGQALVEVLAALLLLVPMLLVLGAIYEAFSLRYFVHPLADVLL